MNICIEEEVLTRELELLEEKYDAIIDGEKQCDRSTTGYATSTKSVNSSATKVRPASVRSGRSKQSLTSKATSKQ